jgi:hypothetical protein
VNKGKQRCGEEDVPWMPRVADLVEGICQDTLPFGLERYVKIDPGTGGWVAQTLPVDWDSIPGVLDHHFIPSFTGRREVGEEHSNKEGKHREPVPLAGRVVLHE